MGKRRIDIHHFPRARCLAIRAIAAHLGAGHNDLESKVSFHLAPQPL